MNNKKKYRYKLKIIDVNIDHLLLREK
jgi:hypothetical protein